MKPLWITALLILVAGCAPEQIETYRVPKKSPAPAVQSTRRDATPDRPAFTVRLPEGWSEQPGSGMRLATYTIGETSIDFSLIALSVGDTVSNVNRWRGQVGLPPAEPAAIMSRLEMLQAGDRKIRYIEIYNEAADRGIIAAIVDLSPQFWFFSAKGTAAELKANASDIRGFEESLEIPR